MLDLFPETTGAVFSPCRIWRYRLWRIWDESKPYCNFLMLNPSTADETVNDPTVSRAISYARDWGFGALHVTNIFAYRATDPGDMLAASEPIGAGNDRHIEAVAKEAGLVICAWGNHGKHLGRSEAVRKLLRVAGVAGQCLTITGEGEPGHPLYLAKALRPISLAVE